MSGHPGPGQRRHRCGDRVGRDGDQQAPRGLRVIQELHPSRIQSDGRIDSPAEMLLVRQAAAGSVPIDQVERAVE